MGQNGKPRISPLHIWSLICDKGARSIHCKEDSLSTNGAGKLDKNMQKNELNHTRINSREMYEGGQKIKRKNTKHLPT